MAKKVRFRLWFHKLNIKRFSNPPHPIKRRSFLSSPPHALDILGFSAPPLQARHSCSSSSDHISVSLLSSPCHSLPVTFSSPHHSLPATFSSPRHSLPATSLSRRSRKASKSSKHQPNFSSALLLSPINCKALDIPYPSGGSSPPYAFMQSPTLQAAAIAMSPAAKIFSPPIRKPHTVLFKSPLHPLACQNSDNPSIEPTSISTTAAEGIDAKMSARASRKAEIYVNSCRSHADCFASQGPAEEESNLIAAGHKTAQQKKSTHANPHAKQSPLIVDCGCHPSFSASFRKTKKTLQACSSCGSNKPRIIPMHSKHAIMQKHDMLGDVKSSISGGESKNSIDCCRENTCPVSAKQDYRKLQLKKRKKRMDVAQITAPKTSKPLFKQQELGHTIPLKSETLDANSRESKTLKGIDNADCNPADSNLASMSFSSSTRDAALLMDGRTLAWEKDFSSFTSEDTFFSSFERSRPSFSSNSSSECFDKKRSYPKPASNHSNLVLNDANVLIHHGSSSMKRSTDDLNRSNPVFSSSSSCVSKEAAKVATSPGNASQSSADGHSIHKLQNTLRSMSCKGHDPLVEVSFNAVDVPKHNEGALRGDTHICAEAASEHPLRINTYHGMKRSSLINPLVEIKEDPCEGGSTDTLELDKPRSSRKFRRSLKDLNLQERLSFNPDYTSSCHSDYYANSRSNLQRRAQVPKKSDVHRKGRDTGSARIRRRAHLQARWRLSDEQIRWQSSVEEEDADDVGCTTLSSQLMHSSSNDHGYMHTQNSFNMPRRRRIRDRKQKHSESKNASIGAPKAASSALQSSPLRKDSEVVDDSTEPCGTSQVMRNAPENTVSKCEAERAVKMSGSPNVNKQSSYANNPRLSDSVAVVKCSKDPLVDFTESMVDMIIEKQMYSAVDLGELLQCFLSLNSREHHDVIVQAFGQVWGKLFQEF